MIRSLRLVDFRCFESLSLEISEEPLVLVGGNAQGKTSILEAICVLVRLHSPRTHRLGQLVRFGQPEFGVAGECWGVERRMTHGKDGVAMRVAGEGCAERRDYLADGGLVVWMGNEDLELVRGPGEVRRRYLDFLASQLDADYWRHCSRYRRALKARNLLLKERRIDETQVTAYTELLVEHGQPVQQQRALLVERLREPVAAAQGEVGGRDEQVELRYDPTGGFDLAAAFVQVAEQERRTRQTVVGPHRDDFGLILNGMSAAQFGSEGQQRTLAIALKLAQGAVLRSETGRMPLYLLDDIFGELDPQRRNALMMALPEDAQRLITTTSLGWMQETARLWRQVEVQGGKIFG